MKRKIYRINQEVSKILDPSQPSWSAHQMSGQYENQEALKRSPQLVLMFRLISFGSQFIYFILDFIF